MKVSDKIKKLNKIGKLVVKESGELADFVMVGLEYVDENWYATLMFDGWGDGHPSYIDNFEHKVGDDNELVMCGVSKTLMGSLNKLEKKMNRYLGQE